MNLRLPTIRSPRKGFTIVEISIAAAISLVAITSVLSVFIASSKMILESSLRNRAAMEARQVVDVLSSDIRAASDVVASFGAYTADDKTLILKLPAIDANGFPIDVDKQFDHIIYHPDNTDSSKLVRSVVADGSSSRITHNKVVGTGSNNGISIHGSYQAIPDALGAYVIYYSFTAVKESGSYSYANPIAGSVRLRNRI